MTKDNRLHVFNPSGASSTLTDVAGVQAKLPPVFFNNKYYVTTPTGEIKSSSDLQTWTSITLPAPAKVTSNISNINGVYYANTDQGLYLSLDQGLNWVKSKTSFNPESQKYSVKGDLNGTFLVSGKNGIWFKPGL